MGGEMSALERMKAQQSAQSVDLASNSSASELEQLQPAAGGLRDSGKVCSLTSAGAMNNEATLEFGAPPMQDFLASRLIKIQNTSFSNDWNRVLNQTVSPSAIDRRIRRLDAQQAQLEAVNSWVNKQINYVADRKLFNRADHWAGAQVTLALGMGDCEDIAIAKMQMLAALGFRRDDMFLTIAKDTLRRSDHALLVVKVDGRYLLLDNTTDELLDGAQAHAYRPILSFSTNRSWIHGF
ncbi:transglutaminase-like cysteine peptidase [uncultured Erythrobacter sp.]|uniref:transglutaminase-like cysteine peptidase n=1 Tax=uncultured Erythrobacter sp. TaxID=263913 RepID=UPI00260CB04C|nr:transglutaminase-like cysteine peptidase [uncultured Erythrobacter sp.]